MGKCQKITQFVCMKKKMNGFRYFMMKTQIKKTTKKHIILT